MSSIYYNIFKGIFGRQAGRAAFGGDTAGYPLANLLAFYAAAGFDTPSWPALRPVTTSATPQVKGSLFSVAAPEDVPYTGLLTTDVITASGTAPTCAVNGTLSMTADFWDMRVHRAGVLWSYLPGINVGQATELDASGNGHHLTLTTTTIVEAVDGAGTNYCNEDGFSTRENRMLNSDNLLAGWTANGSAAATVEGDVFRLTLGGGDFRQNLTGYGYAISRAMTRPYTTLALSPIMRERLFLFTDGIGRIWRFIIHAEDDGLASLNRMQFDTYELSSGNMLVFFGGAAGSYLIDKINMAMVDSSKIPNLGTVVCLGDSVTLQYPAQLARIFPTSTIVNEGVGGERIDQIEARFATSVTAHNPDKIILMAGLNDFKQGYSLAVAQSRYTSLLALCDAEVGASNVLIGNTTPFRADATSTDAMLAIQLQFNAWLLTLGHTVVDQFSDYLQPGTTGDMIYNYTSDGTHPQTNNAANYLAENFAAALGYNCYDQHIVVTSSPIIGRQPAGFQSITDYPGPLNVSATITAGTEYPDITIKAPLGPKFQGIPEWTGDAAVDLSTLSATARTRIGPRGLLIYGVDLDATEQTQSDRYLGVS